MEAKVNKKLTFYFEKIFKKVYVGEDGQIGLTLYNNHKNKI